MNKLFYVFGFLCVVFLALELTETISFKFFVSPFRSFSVQELKNNHMSRPCGSFRMMFYSLSMVTDRLAVAEMAESPAAQQKGLKYVLRSPGKILNVYAYGKRREIYAIAEDQNGKVSYGWFVSAIPEDRLQKAIQNCHQISQ